MALAKQAVIFLAVVLLAALAESAATCRGRYFQCKSSGKCIPQALKCNCEDDCGDGSDEAFPLCNGITFPCKDGGCVDVSRKCDGFMHCLDGSDEAMPMCSAPNITMQDGDVLSVNVGFKKHHGSVGFTLCGSDPTDACVMALVHDVSSSGSLYYTFSEKCASDADCYEDVSPSNLSPSNLGSGNVTFIVERRESSTLVVSLENYSIEVMGVWDFDGETQLRVKPLNWFEDMPVYFSHIKHND